MAIPWAFGRDLIRGGVPTGRTCLSVLDLGSGRLLGLAGAGIRGAWVGAAGDSCMAADATDFTAARFMIGTPSTTATSVGLRALRAATVPCVGMAEMERQGVRSRRPCGRGLDQAPSAALLPMAATRRGFSSRGQSSMGGGMRGGMRGWWRRDAWRRCAECAAGGGGGHGGGGGLRCDRGMKGHSSDTRNCWSGDQDNVLRQAQF